MRVDYIVFMEGKFLPVLYPTEADNGVSFANTTDAGYALGGQNYRMGAVRIRQIRAIVMSCASISYFDEYIDSCIPS